MASATLTSQGQLTLPKKIRDLMGLKTGDRVSFRVREDQTVVVEPETVDLRSLRGAVKSRRHVTLEEMDEAIHAAATGKPRKRR